jgi:putative membrane protein
MYHYGYGMGYGGFHVFGGLLVAALVIFCIFALLRVFGLGRGRRRWMWHAHSALTILNERFAKGEIDQKDYEERKKALLADAK